MRKWPNKRLILLLFLVGGVTYLFVFKFARENGNSTRAPRMDSPAATENAASTSTAYLYFGDKESQNLVSEEFTLYQPSSETPLKSPTSLATAIIDALIKGPREGLTATLPKDTKLNALYITEGGTAYADFSPEIQEHHPRGIQAEFITLYSIVNSLTLNIPQINAVKLLINGREALTLAGHIDIRFPFKANLLIIH